MNKKIQTATKQIEKEYYLYINSLINLNLIQLKSLQSSLESKEINEIIDTNDVIVKLIKNHSDILKKYNMNLRNTERTLELRIPKLRTVGDDCPNWPLASAVSDSDSDSDYDGSKKKYVPGA